MSEEGQDRRSDVLGAYIRAQRQLADLSLRQLADMSKVSNAYLSQIERGLHQPSLRILQSIASALGLSGEALLAEAGLVVPDMGEAAAGVEAAVMADSNLTDDEKHVLVGIYRSFRQRHE